MTTVTTCSNHKKPIRIIMVEEEYDETEEGTYDHDEEHGREET